MSSPRYAVLVGARSDLPRLRRTIDTLGDFPVPFTVRAMSAHRTPQQVIAFASGAQAAGLQAIVAGAGGATHLAGMIAAHTLVPVIGVPVEGGALNGLDTLSSTVQSPGGIPVATG